MISYDEFSTGDRGVWPIFNRQPYDNYYYISGDESLPPLYSENYRFNNNSMDDWQVNQQF